MGYICDKTAVFTRCEHTWISPCAKKRVPAKGYIFVLRCQHTGISLSLQETYSDQKAVSRRPKHG